MATETWSGTTVLKITFENRKWTNKVHFELLNRPVTWKIMYYDYNRDMMVQLRDARGNEVAGSIGSDSDINKYMKFRFDFPMIHTNLMEIHLERGSRINWNRTLESMYPELADTPSSEWYTVRVRNVEFSHEIRSRNDLPPTFDEDVSIRGPLGHVERLQVEDWDASKATDGNLDTYWQCEPQPVGDAIVPLYIDVRGPNGEAQLIDRLRIDPTYSGPTMNIYTSEDDSVPSDFVVSNHRELLKNIGDVQQILDLGALFDAASQSLLVDSNDRMRINVNEPWAIGVTYRPIDLATTGNRTLFSLKSDNEVKLVYSGDSFRVFRGAAEMVAVVAPLEERDYSIIVGHTPEGEYVLSVDGVTESALQAESTYGAITEFRIGNNSLSDELALGYIREVFVRQDSVSSALIQAYRYNTTDMMISNHSDAEPLSDPTKGDWRGLFLGRFIKELTAHIGPDEHYYSMKVWTPVVRDYTLNRGTFGIPPTKCKFIKLEFSYLVQKPYPIWDEGIEKMVKFYPQWVHQWYATVEEHVRLTTQRASRRVRTTRTRSVTRNIDDLLGNSWLYDTINVREDVPPVGYNWDRQPVGLFPERIIKRNAASQGISVDDISKNRSVIGYNPNGQPIDPNTTEVYYKNTYTATVNTPVTSYKTVRWNEQSLETYEVPRLEQKRFYKTVRHEYDERKVVMDTQQAYFVGINNLEVLRAEYSSVEDSPEFIETFEDEHSLEINEWGALVDWAPTVNYDLSTGLDATVGDGVEADDMSPSPFLSQFAVETDTHDSLPTLVASSTSDTAILAKAQDHYFDIVIRPTLGTEGEVRDIKLGNLTMLAASAASSLDNVGFEIRSSHDGYKSNLYYSAISTVRPDWFSYDIDLSAIPRTSESITLRFYIFGPENVHMRDIAISTQLYEGNQLVGDRAYSTDAGQQIITKDMPSHSMFKAVQIASEASDWESQFNNAQMSLVITDHIESVNSNLVPSTQITGEGAGQVLVANQINSTVTAEVTQDPPSGHTNNLTAAELEVIINTWLSDNPQIGTDIDVRYEEWDDGGFIYQYLVFEHNAVTWTLAWGSETIIQNDPAGTMQSSENVAYVLFYGPEYGMRTEGGIYSTPDIEHTYDYEDGVYTSSGSYDSSNSLISAGVRTSTMARIYLPDSSAGTYEMRIMANGEIVALRRFTKLAPKKWIELELLYSASEAQFNFQAEIVQVDENVSEPFAVDFLGIFQSPIRWELSNDGGTTWKDVSIAMNNPSAFVVFDEPGNSLKVRLTSQRAGVHVQSFVVVPWYQESPTTRRIPIDYTYQWHVNESEDLRAVKHKPIFKMWNRPFPRAYSLDQQGAVPESGSGVSL